MFQALSAPSASLGLRACFPKKGPCFGVIRDTYIYIYIHTWAASAQMGICEGCEGVGFRGPV